MGSGRWSDQGDVLTLKILVTGGHGAGKTSFIGSVSEIRPLRTEEIESEDGAGSAGDGAGSTGHGAGSTGHGAGSTGHGAGSTQDSPEGEAVEGEGRVATTTVALDFGRITLREGLSLYLFGTPGQMRFRRLREELTAGSLGAVVLVDTRRLADSFPAVDHLEQSGIPFAVAVNRFTGAGRPGGHDPEQVARALNLTPGTPVMLCDARERASARQVLAALVEYAGRFQTARLLETVLR